MNLSSLSEIKREKKKSVYLREISELLHLLAEEEKEVSRVYVTRVELSADTGICYIYFSAYSCLDEKSSKEVFEEVLKVLKLYKPSIRKSLSKKIHARYIPELIFCYDEKREKVNKINSLLEKVHQELQEQ
jgi:ribosome-binding factor A